MSILSVLPSDESSGILNKDARLIKFRPKLNKMSERLIVVGIKEPDHVEYSQANDLALRAFFSSCPASVDVNQQAVSILLKLELIRQGAEVKERRFEIHRVGEIIGLADLRGDFCGEA